MLPQNIFEADYRLPGESLRVDTCCIDKRSSAELTEAIDSCTDGTRKESTECYVFLGRLSLLRLEIFLERVNGLSEG